MAERALSIGAPRFAVLGANQAVLHAVRWLSQFGAALTGVKNLAEADALDPAPAAVLIAGDAFAGAREDGGVARIWLWDYEVGRAGSGEMACAVSGVSTVIGEPDGPPGVMPAQIAEKWCGLFGASLALSLLLAHEGQAPKRIDVSAADALRAFAEQNSGNHAGVPYGWRRNGRTAVEHGGVFPQGFFPCRDGFMAVQARSRPDWQAILAALGNPAWAADMQNPFTLSEDDSAVRPLLEAELGKRDRAHLLQRAAETGAPMAPVLSAEEAASWRVYREGFLDAEGKPGLPFAVRR